MRTYCKYCKRNHTDKQLPGRTYVCEDCRKKVRRLQHLHNTIGTEAMIEDAKGTRSVKARGADKDFRQSAKKPIGAGFLAGEQYERKTITKSNDWLLQYNKLVDELGLYERIELE